MSATFDPDTPFVVGSPMIVPLTFRRARIIVPTDEWSWSDGW